MTAQDIIKIAKAELGIKENPANSNNVKYNTWYYGHPVQDGIPNRNDRYPWCAVFISWIFQGTGLVPRTASCESMLKWFEQKGQVVKNPQAGDIVFFKYSTNNRRTNHVGLVVSVSGNIINTIEGNTSSAGGSQDNGGCVMQRNRTKNIVAYARPNYNGNQKIVITDARPTIREGSKGNDVLFLHKQLKKLKYGVDVNSNYFSATTKICLVNFQTVRDLEPDGICGPKTWKEIEKI